MSSGPGFTTACYACRMRLPRWSRTSAGLVGLVLASAVCGCASTSDPTLEALPPDQRIRTQIERGLAEDDRVPADRVRVEVTDGVVVLSGIVPTVEIVRRALELAERPDGVVEIVNRIRVLSRRGSRPAPATGA